METTLPISLKLNFTPNTLRCYRLMLNFPHDDWFQNLPLQDLELKKKYISLSNNLTAKIRKLEQFKAEFLHKALNLIKRTRL